jgi:hypothetical protein
MHVEWRLIAVQVCKLPMKLLTSVYEGYLKQVLRERGRMDVSQAESTVAELVGQAC